MSVWTRSLIGIGTILCITSTAPPFGHAIPHPFLIDTPRISPRTRWNLSFFLKSIHTPHSSAAAALADDDLSVDDSEVVNATATPTLTDAALPQKHDLGIQRRKWLNLGAWFASLSAKEALVYFLMSSVSEFYKLLPAKDSAGFLSLVAKQVSLIFGLGALQGLNTLLGGRFQAMRRQEISQALLDSYLTQHDFYNTLFNSDVDNPDHRLATDVDKFVQAETTILEKGMLSPFLLVAYTVMTWQTMGAMGPLAIYSFFFLSAILSRLVMAPTQRATEAKESLEATYRLEHGLLRTHGESIAFSRGEEKAHDDLSQKLHSVIEMQQTLAKHQGIQNGVTEAVGYLGSILSYLIVAASFFTGSFDHLDKSARAAVLSKNAFYAMYLINVLTGLTSLSKDATKYLAYQKRIQTLSHHFSRRLSPLSAPLESHNSSSSEEVLADGDALLSVRSLDIQIPNSHSTLISGLSFDVKFNQSVLVIGDNGSGKTSLARVLANLWIPVRGTVRFATSHSPRPNAMFLPQKPYLPSGSLLDITVYPFVYASLDSTRQRAAHDTLDKAKNFINYASVAHLFHNRTLAHSALEYATLLSAGEMQKLSFLRIFHWRPLVAVLDEATSSMDLTSKQETYQFLQILNITCLSISHDPVIQHFHAKTIDLGVYHAAAMLKKDLQMRKIVNVSRSERMA